MATQALSLAKNKARRALREMLLCAAVLMIIIDFLTGSPALSGASIATAIVAGLIFCPVPWIIYRVGRFVLNR
jgi:fatty acid desaturase